MPAAIAITFFTAPPTSTPGDVVARSTRAAARWCSSRRERRARARRRAAASVSAVGRPRATSSAKLGPESAPHGASAAERLGDDLVRQLRARLLEPLARPDDAAAACPRRAPARARRAGPAVGVATRTRSGAAERCGRIVRDARRAAGRADFGRYAAAPVARERGALRRIARPERDGVALAQRDPRAPCPTRPRRGSRCSRRAAPSATAPRPAPMRTYPVAPSAWRTCTQPSGRRSSSSSRTSCLRLERERRARRRAAARTSATGALTSTVRRSTSALRSTQDRPPNASRTFTQAPSSSTITSSGIVAARDEELRRLAPTARRRAPRRSPTERNSALRRARSGTAARARERAVRISARSRCAARGAPRLRLLARCA